MIRLLFRPISIALACALALQFLPSQSRMPEALASSKNSANFTNQALSSSALWVMPHLLALTTLVYGKQIRDLVGAQNHTNESAVFLLPTGCWIIASAVLVSLSSLLAYISPRVWDWFRWDVTPRPIRNFLTFRELERAVEENTEASYFRYLDILSRATADPEFRNALLEKQFQFVGKGKGITFEPETSVSSFVTSQLAKDLRRSLDKQILPALDNHGYYTLAAVPLKGLFSEQASRWSLEIRYHRLSRVKPIFLAKIFRYLSEALWLRGVEAGKIDMALEWSEDGSIISINNVALEAPHEFTGIQGSVFSLLRNRLPALTRLRYNSSGDEAISCAFYDGIPNLEEKIPEYSSSVRYLDAEPQEKETRAKILERHVRQAIQKRSMNAAARRNLLQKLEEPLRAAKIPALAHHPLLGLIDSWSRCHIVEENGVVWIETVLGINNSWGQTFATDESRNALERFSNEFGRQLRQLPTPKLIREMADLLRTATIQPEEITPLINRWAALYQKLLTHNPTGSSNKNMEIFRRNPTYYQELLKGFIDPFLNPVSKTSLFDLSNTPLLAYAFHHQIYDADLFDFIGSLSPEDRKAFERDHQHNGSGSQNWDAKIKEYSKGKDPSDLPISSPQMYWALSLIRSNGIPERTVLDWLHEWHRRRRESDAQWLKRAAQLIGSDEIEHDMLWAFSPWHRLKEKWGNGVPVGLIEDPRYEPQMSLIHEIIRTHSQEFVHDWRMAFRLAGLFTSADTNREHDSFERMLYAICARDAIFERGELHLRTHTKEQFVRALADLEESEMNGSRLNALDRSFLVDLFTKNLLEMQSEQNIRQQPTNQSDQHSNHGIAAAS